jgi:hypothetical protein
MGAHYDPMLTWTDDQLSRTRVLATYHRDQHRAAYDEEVVKIAQIEMEQERRVMAKLPSYSK